MPYLNEHTVMGHLGKDVELRYMPNGNSVANFSVATSEKWKDKQTGEQKERTDWHNVVVYGKPAEWAGEHRKGELVLVKGPSRTRKWQDKSGQDRYTTEIHAQDVKWFQRSESSSEGRQSEPASYEGGGGLDPNDDIPFAPVKWDAY